MGRSRRSLHRAVGTFGFRVITASLPAWLVLVPLWRPTHAAGQEPVELRVGILVDDLTGRPIVGATVTVDPGSVRRTSDINGTFQVPLRAGAYALVVSALGYADLRVSIEVPPTPTAPLELRMVPVPLSVEGLEVESGQRDESVDLSGVVRDLASGKPLIGATVSLPFASRRWVTLTDEGGAFHIGGVRTGVQWVQARHLGYEGAAVSVMLPEGSRNEPVEIMLRPDSALLRGVAALSSRWESARRSVGGMPVRSFGRERIAVSGWQDAQEVLRSAGVTVVPCEEEPAMMPCVQLRGAPVAMEVCIDGLRVVGGLDQLRTYHPRDLHLVEVFDHGRYVRAYSVAFMEHYGRRADKVPISCSDPNLG